MRPLSPGMPLDAEIALEHDDHAAWCAYMAPRIIERYSDEPEQVKREVWARLSEPLRAAITKLKQRITP